MTTRHDKLLDHLPKESKCDSCGHTKSNSIPLCEHCGNCVHLALIGCSDCPDKKSCTDYLTELLADTTNNTKLRTELEQERDYFIHCYKSAVTNGRDTFTYRGQYVLTDYARYLIQYWNTLSDEQDTNTEDNS